VMVFGGPRSGKTGWLAGRVLDAPGAVLVTSTRTDLYGLCAPLRARRGPVFVFNAVGLAGIRSSITFDPLTGCTDAVTAMERATDMLAAVSRAGARGGGGDREFWDAQARRVLAALLHAAALGGRSMSDVQRWLGEPDKADREVPALLRKSGVAGLEQDALQFLGTNDKTRTSITSTVMPALLWLNNPPAAAAAQPGHGFDVAQLLAARATVFLLGAEEAQTAPLVCALTGHIAREARRLAATAPSGRLDPPLTLALDEAALISPVPLESWTADMGGRGVTIIAAFQSRAQLLARWGEHNTATILNNTGAVMVFAGTRDRDDLLFWSNLSGDRDERISTTDMHGQVASRSLRRVPVLQPAQIANLPFGRVLVIRRGIAPVIGRVQMAWRRRDVRVHDFVTEHPVLAARLTRWAAAARRLWQRLTRPLRVAAAVSVRWVVDLARRVVGPVTGWLRRLAQRWVRHLTWRRRRARVRVVSVDLPVWEMEAPTVPLPVITPELASPDGRAALSSGRGNQS
jgi:type IV secretion system protein VirD4